MNKKRIMFTVAMDKQLDKHTNKRNNIARNVFTHVGDNDDVNIEQHNTWLDRLCS